MAWQPHWKKTALTQQPAEAQAAVVAPMTAPLSQEPAKVWAMREVDIEPVLAWLHPALQKKWPRCMESSLRFWLKTAIMDRLTHVVCSENVCAMVQVIIDVKEPEPRVVETFLRGNKGAEDADRYMVYDYLASWSKSIGAREFVIGMDSDLRTDASKLRVSLSSAIKHKASEKTYFSVMLRDDD